MQTANRIPKIIHICWFGPEKLDKKLEMCRASRDILLRNGYEVKIWNEDNVDFDMSEPLRKAYEAKKWSLVSNYVRLHVLHEFGGIYLDADVEIVKPFDDLLSYEFFLGFMWECTLGTAVIGAAPGNQIIRAILDIYDNVPGGLISPNNNTFTDYFIHHVDGFRLNGQSQRVGSGVVFAKTTFEQPSLFRRKNYSIHHFAQSWVRSSSMKRLIKSAVVGKFSLYLYRLYICEKSKRISPYYDLYRSTRLQDGAKS